jgi:hypothetical protein
MNAIASTTCAQRPREIRRPVRAALLDRECALPVAEYTRVAPEPEASPSPALRTQLERRFERPFRGSETS